MIVLKYELNNIYLVLVVSKVLCYIMMKFIRVIFLMEESVQVWLFRNVGN